jgi:hypothetical protein
MVSEQEVTNETARTSRHGASPPDQFVRYVSNLREGRTRCQEVTVDNSSFRALRGSERYRFITSQHASGCAVDSDALALHFKSAQDNCCDFSTTLKS